MGEMLPGGGPAPKAGGPPNFLQSVLGLRTLSGSSEKLLPTPTCLLSAERLVPFLPRTPWLLRWPMSRQDRHYHTNDVSTLPLNNGAGPVGAPVRGLLGWCSS